MTKVLITNDRSSAIVLRTLFRLLDLWDVNIIDGGESSDSLALGASYAAVQNVKTAIVINSNLVAAAADRSIELEFIETYPELSGSSNFKLFVAYPNLQQELFADPENFEATFGIKLSLKQKDRFSRNWSLVMRDLRDVYNDPTREILRTAETEAPDISIVMKSALIASLANFIRHF